jgi:uncharacterized Ntn-hydrolase superfamily protein
MGELREDATVMLLNLRTVVTVSAALFSIPQAGLAQQKPGPLAHTYSIVARDPVTGDMGVAVQSHAFSVGAIVTWGEAGIGVVATQSLVDPGYGGKGLELMRKGVSAPDALKQLVAADPENAGRQVAMLDSQGRVSVYTGSKAIAAAGHLIGNQYSAQANLMRSDKVWSAMASAYESAKGDLADRLLAALDGAQNAGGDIRGKMSSALLVVRAKSSGRPWSGADRLFDLRVDEHPEPLIELRRLVRLQRAANHSNRGDELMNSKKINEALAEYREAMRLAPEITEFVFWFAATLLTVDAEAEAMSLFRDLLAKEPIWFEVLKRLPAAGLFPDDPALLKRVEALLPK